MTHIDQLSDTKSALHLTPKHAHSHPRPKSDIPYVYQGNLTPHADYKLASQLSPLTTHRTSHHSPPPLIPPTHLTPHHSPHSSPPTTHLTPHHSPPNGLPFSHTHPPLPLHWIRRLGPLSSRGSGQEASLLGQHTTQERHTGVTMVEKGGEGSKGGEKRRGGRGDDGG